VTTCGGDGHDGRPGLAHAAQIVALHVEDHRELRPLLLVGVELAHELLVEPRVRGAPAGALDRLSREARERARVSAGLRVEQQLGAHRDHPPRRRAEHGPERRRKGRRQRLGGGEHLKGSAGLELHAQPPREVGLIELAVVDALDELADARDVELGRLVLTDLEPVVAGFGCSFSHSQLEASGGCLVVGHDVDLVRGVVDLDHGVVAPPLAVGAQRRRARLGPRPRAALEARALGFVREDPDPPRRARAGRAVRRRAPWRRIEARRELDRVARGVGEPPVRRGRVRGDEQREPRSRR
jgi:hypothetical protein